MIAKDHPDRFSSLNFSVNRLNNAFTVLNTPKKQKNLTVDLQTFKNM
jgi:hypothetical protein